VALADLGGYPIVCMPEGTGVRTVFDQACAAAGRVLDITLQASAPGAVADLAIRGLGIAILSESMAAHHQRRLKALPIDDIETPAVLSLVWPAALPAISGGKGVVTEVRTRRYRPGVAKVGVPGLSPRLHPLLDRCPSPPPSAPVEAIRDRHGPSSNVLADGGVGHSHHSSHVRHVVTITHGSTDQVSTCPRDPLVPAGNRGADVTRPCSARWVESSQRHPMRAEATVVPLSLTTSTHRTDETGTGIRAVHDP